MEPIPLFEETIFSFFRRKLTWKFQKAHPIPAFVIGKSDEVVRKLFILRRFSRKRLGIEKMVSFDVLWNEYLLLLDQFFLP